MRENAAQWRIPPPWPLLVILAMLLAYSAMTSCNSSKKLTDKSVSKSDSTSKLSIDSTSKAVETKKSDSSGKKEWESETVIDFNDGGKIKIKPVDLSKFFSTLDGKVNLDTSKSSIDLEGVKKLTHRRSGKDTSSKNLTTETNAGTELKKRQDTDVKVIEKKKEVDKQTKRVPWYLFVVAGIVILLIIYFKRK